MTELRLGSLCSGIGGLDLAVEAVTGASPAFFAEVDKDASRVLAHRWPDVPNLGDLRTADLPDVDILTAGFPCQPVSQAGKRQGTDDGRWLFDDIAEAVGRMGTRPRLNTFGDYAPAVARWADILGRPAPSPTIDSNGKPRLSPDFVEWMLGYPEGWTDVGISRTGRLRCLGNAVQPQVPLVALPQLLARLPLAVAA